MMKRQISFGNTPPLFFSAFFFFVFLISIRSFAQPLAFPGAEGFAAGVSGGRGGVVFEVTTLEDDVTNPPAGSLRWALKDTTSLPRTIVFRVSGYIILKGRLDVGKNNVTIAGQTAPGDGICLRKYPMKVYGKNIIIRYIRFRPGEETHANNPAIYGIDCENAQNVIVDHCSFSWAIEENATFYDNKWTTVQWCVISEALKNSYNPKGAHSYAGVWGGQYATYHHNLIAHCDSRNPRFNGSRAHDTVAFVDYRNNVIYNWGANSAYGGEVEIAGGVSRINMVNNYYKYGPATSSSKKNRIVQPYDTAFITRPGSVSKWYINGNYVDGYPAITSGNWSGGVQPYDTRYALSSFRVDTPFAFPAVVTESAEDAYISVLAKAGATLPKRDTVDLRAINNTKNRAAGAKNGIIDSVADVGGWPPYNSLPAPVDSDHDGMPDAWETAQGFNPNNPADGNGDADGDGYTNLEEYLNELVAIGPVSVEGQDFQSVPTEFTLMQNYPNPFNPVTSIKYGVGRKEYGAGNEKAAGNRQQALGGNLMVTLKVYDLLGNEVATLVNEEKAAGTYEVKFDASSLPGGVYFYQLQGGNRVLTGKMVLLK